MKKILILAQDHCPKCVVLEQFLSVGLKNKYIENIEYVKREDNESLFMKLVRKHGIQSTPALVCGDELLVNTEPSKVIEFIENNL